LRGFTGDRIATVFVAEAGPLAGFTPGTAGFAPDTGRLGIPGRSGIFPMACVFVFSAGRGNGLGGGTSDFRSASSISSLSDSSSSS
jgi:hypothetical protein